MFEISAILVSFANFLYPPSSVSLYSTTQFLSQVQFITAVFNTNYPSDFVSFCDGTNSILSAPSCDDTQQLLSAVSCDEKHVENKK